MTWREEVTEEIMADEGLRLRPYADTRGKLTIGYGRNLSSVGISKEEALYLLNSDISNALHDCMTHVRCWQQLTPVRQKAVLNLMFNMGWSTLETFTTFWSLMDGGKYIPAAHDLGTTLWAHEIQPTRADRILTQLIQGAEGQSEANV